MGIENGESEDGTPRIPEQSEILENGAHWYGSNWTWANPKAGLRAAVPLLAELCGAGVVATNADDAWWYGASNHRDWDVSGNGRLVDVKRAWLHNPHILGFGGPPSGSYDPTRVHDIMLVHLEDADVATDHAYAADGQVRFTMTGRPRAAYRVPVLELNKIMKRDGNSKVRYLVRLADLKTHQVRGENA
ncbi:hypothetical protein [Streptacidiphilus carbonis]|uniref:hypothetical protein n=1 Tax=Streptacidiphilus carbonis TaxID=105422 RepID=UPI0005A7C459|nr:hypothetical protein [Streptacidiphilus carbonis]